MSGVIEQINISVMPIINETVKIRPNPLNERILHRMGRPIFEFRIPAFRKLTESDAWEKATDDDTKFLASRLHFAIFRIAKRNPRIKFGEPIGRISVHKGSLTTHEAGTSYTATAMNYRAVTKSALVESSLSETICGAIGAQLGVPNLKSIVANATKSWQKSERQQFSECLELRREIKLSRTVSSKTTRVFRDEDCEYSILPQYHETLLAIHLTWVDYLEVEYSQRLLGLRRKRHKKPEFCEGSAKPPNLLKILTPISVISMWELYDDVEIKPADEEYDLLEDPCEVVTFGGDGIQTPHVEVNLKPSLYQISNAAFPLLWIKGKWKLSVKELEEIERIEQKKRLGCCDDNFINPLIDKYSSKDAKPQNR